MQGLHTWQSRHAEDNGQRMQNPRKVWRTYPSQVRPCLGAQYPLQLQRIYNSDYNNELIHFLPRSILLKKPPGAQLGFNIRGGKASQLGIFISKVIPDSDAHRAGLQEGDQVLTVNNVDFQDIEHSKITSDRKRERFTSFPFHPYLEKMVVKVVLGM
ncbi:PDZ domain-containing protein 11 isoform X1 [Pseudophryne corroboree]|uniref:PDZ domain-containing protein 11 isoform X1 n=1 Tax=Pseudophryne corroboree TaxID=495146 RepID=UPI003081D90E